MNLGEWTFKRALTYPQRCFLKEEDKHYDNRRFNQQVNKMAHALIDLDIKKGERVATLMVNSSEFLEIFFACAKIGAIIVPVNFNLAMPELEYIIKDSAPRILIYSSNFVEKVEHIKAAGRINLALNQDILTVGSHVADDGCGSSQAAVSCKIALLVALAKSTGLFNVIGIQLHCVD